MAADVVECAQIWLIFDCYCVNVKLTKLFEPTKQLKGGSIQPTHSQGRPSFESPQLLEPLYWVERVGRLRLHLVDERSKDHYKSISRSHKPDYRSPNRMESIPCSMRWIDSDDTVESSIAQRVKEWMIQLPASQRARLRMWRLDSIRTEQSGTGAKSDFTSIDKLRLAFDFFSRPEWLEGSLTSHTTAANQLSKQDIREATPPSCYRRNFFSS